MFAESGWFTSCTICLHDIKREVSTFSFLVGTIFYSWSDIDFFFFPPKVLYTLSLVHNEKWQNVWERGRKRVSYSKKFSQHWDLQAFDCLLSNCFRRTGKVLSSMWTGGDGSVVALFWLVSHSKTFVEGFVNCRVLWWHNAVVIKTRLVIAWLIFLAPFAGWDNTRAGSYRGRMNCELSEHADGVNGWVTEQKAFHVIVSLKHGFIKELDTTTASVRPVNASQFVSWNENPWNISVFLSTCTSSELFRLCPDSQKIMIKPQWMYRISIFFLILPCIKHFIGNLKTFLWNDRRGMTPEGRETVQIKMSWPSFNYVQRIMMQKLKVPVVTQASALDSA